MWSVLVAYVGGRKEMPAGLWLENLKENVGMNHVTIGMGILKK